MNEIKVELKNNPYKILIGSSILPDIKNLIDKNYENILVVIDKNVFNHFEKTIKNSLLKISNQIQFYILKPGEKSKSFSELKKIHSFLLEKNFGRDSLIIAIGGGVTGDLVGFAASTFLRGVDLVHIPTTLLAAVDSSIGGKTGINFNNKKNMIGAFYQPEKVIIDMEFLYTLPKNEINSGVGEIIKYAFLADDDFYNFTKNNLHKIFKKDSDVLQKIIYKSAGIKASVVSQDEKESGLRKILNLGHTFAHAFESDLNFKIKHGEAVIAGIISSLYLSEKINIIDKNKLAKFLELPSQIKLSKKLNSMNMENLFEIMKMDKKNRKGKIKFVLVSDIGEILIDMQADKKNIFYAINKMQKVCV